MKLAFAWLLEANSNEILKLVCRQGLQLIGAGVCVGLPAAWPLARAMASLLLNISPAEAVAFARRWRLA